MSNYAIMFYGPDCDAEIVEQATALGINCVPGDPARVLSILTQAHPDFERQLAVFASILQELPCAVCGDADHNARDGHPIDALDSTPADAVRMRRHREAKHDGDRDDLCPLCRIDVARTLHDGQDA